MEVTYSDLDNAPAVLLAGFEPEEESPIVYLRLRKAARKNALQVMSIAPFATRGLTKMRGKLIECAPGAEATALDSLADDVKLKLPGALILVGERLAGCPWSALGGKQIGGSHRCPVGVGAATRRRTRCGGSRCAARPVARRPPVERCVGPRADRRRLERQRTTRRPMAATPRPFWKRHATGELGALLIGGVELADLPDPDAALAAVDAAPFVVSLEVRESAVTALADVVFPVAPVVEKAGSFVNWEGRIRPFEPALQTNFYPDLRVLNFLADEIGVDLALPTALAAGEEMARLGLWAGTRPSAPQVSAERPSQPGAGQAVLASWRMLLDAGRLQDGEPFLAGTARPPIARLSTATAGEIGAADGDLVTVSSDRGAITLPLAITEMPDRVVWLPLNPVGAGVHQQLAVAAGAVVSIGRAEQ